MHIIFVSLACASMVCVTTPVASMQTCAFWNDIISTVSDSYTQLQLEFDAIHCRSCFGPSYCDLMHSIAYKSWLAFCIAVETLQDDFIFSGSHYRWKGIVVSLRVADVSVLVSVSSAMWSIIQKAKSGKNGPRNGKNTSSPRWILKR